MKYLKSKFLSFTVVLFQLIAPLIAIGAIYKGSDIKDPNIKYSAQVMLNLENFMFYNIKFFY